MNTARLASGAAAGALCLTLTACSSTKVTDAQIGISAGVLIGGMIGSGMTAGSIIGTAIGATIGGVIAYPLGMYL